MPGACTGGTNDGNPAIIESDCLDNGGTAWATTAGACHWVPGCDFMVDPDGHCGDGGGVRE